MFTTYQPGIELAKELEMPGALRQVRGDSFTLSLMVAIPSSLEDKPLDLIVDRLSSDIDGTKGHKLANGDMIIETTARLEPTGETFNISILFQLERMHDNGAAVFVSKDMERIILEQAARSLDQFLAQEPEG